MVILAQSVSFDSWVDFVAQTKDDLKAPKDADRVAAIIKVFEDSEITSPGELVGVTASDVESMDGYDALPLPSRTYVKRLTAAVQVPRTVSVAAPTVDGPVVSPQSVDHDKETLSIVELKRIKPATPFGSVLCTIEFPVGHSMGMQQLAKTCEQSLDSIAIPGAVCEPEGNLDKVLQRLVAIGPYLQLAALKDDEAGSPCKAEIFEISSKYQTFVKDCVVQSNDCVARCYQGLQDHQQSLRFVHMTSNPRTRIKKINRAMSSCVDSAASMKAESKILGEKSSRLMLLAEAALVKAAKCNTLKAAEKERIKGVQDKLQEDKAMQEDKDNKLEAENAKREADAKNKSMALLEHETQKKEIQAKLLELAGSKARECEEEQKRHTAAVLVARQQDDTEYNDLKTDKNGEFKRAKALHDEQQTAQANYKKAEHQKQVAGRQQKIKDLEEEQSKCMSQWLRSRNAEIKTANDKVAGERNTEEEKRNTAAVEAVAAALVAALKQVDQKAGETAEAALKEVADKAGVTAVAKAEEKKEVAVAKVETKMQALQLEHERHAAEAEQSDKAMEECVSEKQRLEAQRDDSWWQGRRGEYDGKVKEKEEEIRTKRAAFKTATDASLKAKNDKELLCAKHKAAKTSTSPGGPLKAAAFQQEVGKADRLEFLADDNDAFKEARQKFKDHEDSIRKLRTEEADSCPLHQTSAFSLCRKTTHEDLAKQDHTAHLAAINSRYQTQEAALKKTLDLLVADDSKKDEAWREAESKRKEQYVELMQEAGKLAKLAAEILNQEENVSTIEQVISCLHLLMQCMGHVKTTFNNVAEYWNWLETQTDLMIKSGKRIQEEVEDGLVEQEFIQEIGRQIEQSAGIWMEVGQQTWRATANLRDAEKTIDAFLTNINFGLEAKKQCSELLKTLGVAVAEICPDPDRQPMTEVQSMIVVVGSSCGSGDEWFPSDEPLPYSFGVTSIECVKPEDVSNSLDKFANDEADVKFSFGRCVMNSQIEMRCDLEGSGVWHVASGNVLQKVNGEFGDCCVINDGAFNDPLSVAQIWEIAKHHRTGSIVLMDVL